MRSYPLISCIMPTRNRREYIEQAIDCYLAQTWPNKELIIADNGDDAVLDIAARKGISRYVSLDAGVRRSTGEMRNICCGAARGDYIAHFDDDDWSHPRRLLEQYKLMQSVLVPVVGYRSICFWDEAADTAWHFTTANEYDYCLGTSLFYQRGYWKAHGFEHHFIGEDDVFVNKALNANKLKAAEGYHRIIARVHRGNTSPKCADEQWKPISIDTMFEITGYPQQGEISGDGIRTH